jgi:hypothetical protein
LSTELRRRGPRSVLQDIFGSREPNEQMERDWAAVSTGERGDIGLGFPTPRMMSRMEEQRYPNTVGWTNMLGNGIVLNRKLIEDESKTDPEYLRKTLGHELEHVKQVREQGPFTVKAKLIRDIFKDPLEKEIEKPAYGYESARNVRTKDIELPDEEKYGIGPNVKLTPEQERKYRAWVFSPLYDPRLDRRRMGN